jgi:hypothetical protein
MFKSSRCILFLLALLLFACQSNNDALTSLDKAEDLMESKPDSALTILKNVKKSGLSEKDNARYALLMSIALDKNYIDTASFDVIQPAIDYYLKKGTPDEKLRTYYYQGRIFQNQGNKDHALDCFVKALDESQGTQDSLFIARVLVAQSCIYQDFFDIDSYTSNNLRAAKIYNGLSRKEYEFDCLLNAFNGAIIEENKSLSDSLYKVCNNFDYVPEYQQQKLQDCNLTYYTLFGSNQEVHDFIQSLNIKSISTTNEALSLAFAYNKIGEPQQAKQLLDAVSNCKMEYDTLKYQSIAVPVLKSLGEYKDALLTYEDFSSKFNAITRLRFDQKSQTVEVKHQIELKAQRDAKSKSRIIWGCVGGILISALCIVVLLLLVRSNRVKKELALQIVKAKESENTKLNFEREKLTLENQNLQLERDNKVLETENLSHRIKDLESESDKLKSLIDQHTELPQEVQNAIKVRIEILNSLVASHLSENNKYIKPYKLWVKELTENAEEFMNSNRLAFQVSHPQFIKYFEEHNLTINEINYVCLYAIGLRGKDIGDYIKKPGHVNTSSSIRKKLGIGNHDTNIGIYVRKLLENS